jgi:hypothetical protein
MNGKDKEGSGHNLFQDTIPALTWTDWQIWYIAYTIFSTIQ